MKVAWNNLVDNSTITPSSEQSSYPASNMKDRFMGKTWRTSVVSGTAVFDLGSAQDITCCAIGRHNIGASATITLEANSSDSWTSPAYSLSIDRSADIIMVFFSVQTYRYWRIVVSDDTNPDGYTEIGRPFLGTYLDLPSTEFPESIPRVHTGKVLVADTGRVFGEIGIVYRNPQFHFPIVSIIDEKPDIDTMFATVQNVIPVFVAIWSTMLDIEPAMYAIIDQQKLDWKLGIQLGDFTLTFREVF